MLGMACRLCYNNSMNRLPLKSVPAPLNMLVEGSSMRSASRVVGVSINTVTRLLVDAGNACLKFHDQALRGIAARHIECDEIWSFCYAKKAMVPTAVNSPPEAGDVWTWTALDTDSRIILSWLVGGHELQCAVELMSDLRSRVTGYPQITTDGIAGIRACRRLCFRPHCRLHPAGQSLWLQA